MKVACKKCTHYIPAEVSFGTAFDEACAACISEPNFRGERTYGDPSELNKNHDCKLFKKTHSFFKNLWFKIRESEESA